MATKEIEQVVKITAPNFQLIELELEGTAPLVQNRFSSKAIAMMKAKMEAGSLAKKGGAKAARDFAADFEGAMHKSTEGWVGVPASAIRSACIAVCRTVNYKMTLARMSIFVEPDGFDAVDGQPLVKLMFPAGNPEAMEMPVRNATGVADIRVRPMWRVWSVRVRIRYDADQFSAEEIVNLLNRAGMQVGIGEGRPFSKQSDGLGFGTFRIKPI